MRKKLSEQTPWERVLPRLKGLTDQEAEDVAVRILAPIMAKHVYIKRDGKTYLYDLMGHICTEGDAYARRNKTIIALCQTLHADPSDPTKRIKP